MIAIINCISVVLMSVQGCKLY